MKTRPTLALVTGNPAGPVAVRKPRATPTPESAAALMARAKSQGRRLSLAFADELETMAARARCIAAAGDAVPVGVRELARRLDTDTACQAATIRKLAR